MDSPVITAAAILDSGAPPAPAAAPAASTACAHCAAPGRERCASCRAVVYCGRACQKAAWPAHKALCKHLLSKQHGGKPLASARDFVLEFWRPRFPASIDVGALLPLADDDDDLDEAAAFERCRGAAMDATFSGYSAADSDGARRRLVRAAIEDDCITRDSNPSLAVIACCCIARLCPVALELVLDAGAQPGDASSNGDTILQKVLATIIYPYVWSAHALPHALDSLCLVLARAQPGDWLIGKPGSFPLSRVAEITDPAVSQAVLACITASPGGFPAHAVAAFIGALHMALQQSTAVCVKALLDAGANPNARFVGNPDPTLTPLYVLARCGGSYEFSTKLSLLLAAGARLEAVDSFGWTPLVLAAYNDRIAAYDALLAAGARVSALRVNTDDSPAKYSTVLHVLAGNDSAAMIQRVLATGVLEVDVRAGPAHFKRTPLQQAAGHDASRAVGALLAAGASLAATDTYGGDALGLAIVTSSPKAARLLLEATPPAGRARYKREAVTAVVHHHRAAAAAPSDAAAAAKLAAAQAVAALFAA